MGVYSIAVGRRAHQARPTTSSGTVLIPDEARDLPCRSAAHRSGHSQLLELLLIHELPDTEFNGTSRAEFEEFQAAFASLFAKATWLASHICPAGVHSATVLGK